jgi:hypothetical protein
VTMPSCAVALRGVGIATAVEVPDDLEDRFPGRWDPRRRIHDVARPAIHAAAQALLAAGAWRPGCGEAVDGGQVVGADLHAFGATARFAAQLEAAVAERRLVRRASEFLFALPSSVAALTGMALGLERHQTTVQMHACSGLAALATACDLIRAGRLRRAIATALTACDGDGLDAAHALGILPQDAADDAPVPWALAVSWCLEAVDPDDAPRAEPLVLECAIERASADAVPPRPEDLAAALPDVPPAYRGLSAASLLRATRLLDGVPHPPQHSGIRVSHSDATSGSIRTLVHADPRSRTVATLRLSAASPKA